MQLLLEVVDFLLGQWRLVADEVLAEGLHPGMILVETLAARHRAPRDEVMNVGVVGRIFRGLVVDARPDRGWHGQTRLDDQVFIRVFCLTEVRRQRFCQRQSDALLQSLPRTIGGIAVTRGVEGEDSIAGLRGLLNKGHTLADAFLALHTVHGLQLVVLGTSQPMPLPPMPLSRIRGPTVVNWR